MTADPRSPAIRAIRILTVLILSAAVLTAGIGTLHWPIVGDAPLFHYIDFLTTHGKVPYRDIVDINLPGTYALQYIAIHVLGPTALAWRFFDFALLLVSAVAMIAIALPVDWLAGFFAAALFALIHLRDGPTHTGQRDLMMTALLLPSCAFLFAALRSRAPRNFLTCATLFGLLAGAAATVKPSGILFALALLTFFCLQATSKTAKALALTGIAVPIAAAALWLAHIGALPAFLAINRTLVPYHASLGRPSFPALVIGSFPSVLLAVVIPALPIFILNKSWRTRSAITLLTCTALGAFSYILQGKGFPYHRYPTEAFLLLGCGLLLIPALQSAKLTRCCAIAGVLLATLYLAPASAAIALHFDRGPSEFNQQLSIDLASLGPVQQLQNQVQCIDMTSGCLGTLDQLQLIQATGFLYDCYLFQPTQTPASLQYREDFDSALALTQPEVLVVTNQQCFAMTRDWIAPTRWPQFQSLLDTQYTLQKQYTPPHLVAWWRKPAVPYSYRLYVRKDAAPSPPK